MCLKYLVHEEKVLNVTEEVFKFKSMEECYKQNW